MFLSINRYFAYRGVSSFLDLGGQVVHNAVRGPPPLPGSTFYSAKPTTYAPGIVLHPLSKIGHDFAKSSCELKLSINYLYKKCAPKVLEKTQKDSNDA